MFISPPICVVKLIPEKSWRVKNIITMQATCCLQREAILTRISLSKELLKDTLTFLAYD